MWNATTYAKARARLIEEMGGKCALCGAVTGLEFGHTQEHFIDLAKLNRMARLRQYRKDWQAGIVQLECLKCNHSKPKYHYRTRQSANSELLQRDYIGSESVEP